MTSAQPTTTGRTLPPFCHRGGKTSLARQIVDRMPAHRRHVEPFAGSLAVPLDKGVAPYETVNDLDNRIVTFWRVLRERPQSRLGSAH